MAPRRPSAPRAARAAASFTRDAHRPAAGAVALYWHPMCPYAQRAALCLAAKGVEVERVAIDMADKPEWFTRISRLVPAVVDNRNGDELVILESLDICEWADRELGGAELGAGSQEALEQVDSIVSAGLGVVAGNGRAWGIGKQASPGQAASWERALTKLEGWLQAGPLLGGNATSLADVALFPFVQRFEAALVASRGVRAVDQDKFPRTARWLAAMEASDADNEVGVRTEVIAKAYSVHGSLDYFDYVSSM